MAVSAPMAVRSFCQHQFSAGDCLRRLFIVVLDSLHYHCNYISNWVALHCPASSSFFELLFGFVAPPNWGCCTADAPILHACIASSKTAAALRQIGFSPPPLSIRPSFYFYACSETTSSSSLSSLSNF
jgi:hypothetical protein